MGDVVKKMLYQVPDRFFRLEVLLPADMTVTALDRRLAIQAIFLFSFF
jgi:hypothetical protein